MTLADLRKLAIRKQIRIRFPLKNGMECVVTEKGVAQVPALKAPPDFSLEAELAGAASFVLEPVVANGARTAPRSETIGRPEMSQRTREGAPAGATHDDHEDE